MAIRIPSPQPQHETPPAGAEISPYPSTLIQYTQLPDKVAYVDLISAQIFNQNRAAIRDLTRELGIELKGNCYDLHDRISRVIDPDGRLVLPDTVLSVGKQNADFTTIQAAIDSIADASPSKVYTVHVYPGLYEENVVMKPNIILRGIGLPPLSTDCSSDFIPTISPPNGACIRTTTSGIYYFDRIKLAPITSPAFDTQSGYSAQCEVYFFNGAVVNNQQTEPLLAAATYWQFTFRNSVVAAQSSSKPIIDAEGPLRFDYTFKAVDSYLAGVIDIAAEEIEEVYFFLNKTRFYGKFICRAVMLDAQVFYTTWKNYNASLFDIPGDSGSCLRAFFSHFTLSGSGDIFGIAYGAGKPVLDFFHCALSAAPSAAFSFNNTDRFNCTSCNIGFDDRGF